MFEITADDIALLDDKSLRTLIGFLCESEVHSRGFSTSSVTWGGNQDAADGGLDVRVTLPPGSTIDGFVPRPATGFQVKKKEMPRADILSEMRPSGAIRPVIQELADVGGAYVIVSSKSSTADSALRSRRQAMTEATHDTHNKDSLFLDFYDRNRLATWVRNHVGLIPWVRNAIGKAIPGWRSYGSWAYAPAGMKDDYLFDDKVRIRRDKKDAEDGISALDGIKLIRELLNHPGTVVRLVGLSGVGKTRLVQALFDDHVGEPALKPSLAVYTNMADGPDPQPTGLASGLVAARTRAILVIDNCAPDLHRRLSEVCRLPESTLSVITVEYDIRDDQPEGTEVFELAPSSIDLIEQLIRRRYPGLSLVDAHTAAEFSGGNARIAITLAATVDKNDSLAGLTDEELFRRLFQQRHEYDESLFLAAQACSLVYSFQVDNVSNDDQAELVRLGALVGQTAPELFRNVAELWRRGLVQHRSIWRAVLPYAIANRLATTALQNIPIAAIESQLIKGAPKRLLQSFSRRLAYLHTSKEAVAIVEKWLAPGGLLGDIAKLDDLGIAMFGNATPVAPDAALTALERSFLRAEQHAAPANSARYITQLRCLAYDKALFDRSIKLLLKLAEVEDDTGRHTNATDAFVSLFFLYLSGTHATIEQRLVVINELLLSVDPRRRSLGLKALQAALEAWHFTSFHNFEFGAHSRDHGYYPRTSNDVKHWFGSVLMLAQTLACSNEPCATDVRSVIAQKFRGLWTKAHMFDELERLCRAVSTKQFWREGWKAVRNTQHFDAKTFTSDIVDRLSALEEILRPADLVQKIRAIVLTKYMGSFDLDDFDEEGMDTPKTWIERAEAVAENLGEAAAVDRHAFEAVLVELVSEGGRTWSFGKGLVKGASDHREVWQQFTTALAATEEGKRNIQIFRGFISALQEKNPTMAQELLEDSLNNETLGKYFPELQNAVPIDERGVDRLNRSLLVSKAPMVMYHNLVLGRATDSISGPNLSKLLQSIAEKPGGFNVAINILRMRLLCDNDARREHAPELIEAGQKLLRQLVFTRSDHREDHDLDSIVRVCLAGEEGAAIAEDMVGKLKASVTKYETQTFTHTSLLSGLLAVQPIPTLDELFNDPDVVHNVGIRIIQDARVHRINPLDAVPEDLLLAWCSKEPAIRYRTVAALVTAFRRADEKAPLEWTAVALKLLGLAPDRGVVLKQFVAQFHPRSWSGSRAAIMESHIKLLDDLVADGAPTLTALVAEQRQGLHLAIERERRWETDHDRARDERFE